MAVSLGGFKGPNFPCPETADRRAEPQAQSRSGNCCGAIAPREPCRQGVQFEPLGQPRTSFVLWSLPPSGADARTSRSRPVYALPVTRLDVLDGQLARPR